MDKMEPANHENFVNMAECRGKYGDFGGVQNEGNKRKFREDETKFVRQGKIGTV